MLGDFIKDLWKIFYQSFSFSYRNTLFVKNSTSKPSINVVYEKNDVKILNKKSTQGYNKHIFFILIILITLYSFLNLYSINSQIPNINYVNTSMVTGDFSYNHTFILVNSSLNTFQFSELSNLNESKSITLHYNSSSDLFNNFDSNLSLIFSNFNIDNINISNNTQRQSFLSNNSLLAFFANDFFGYLIYNYDDSISLYFLKVNNLNIGLLLKIISLIVFFLMTIFTFILDSIYVISFALIYKSFTSINLDFVKIFKIAIYSHIPASVIHYFFLFVLQIHLYTLLLMMIFAFSSIYSYKQTYNY